MHFMIYLKIIFLKLYSLNEYIIIYNFYNFDFNIRYNFLILIKKYNYFLSIIIYYYIFSKY